MTWDIAAGILIGGGILALFGLASGFFTYRSGLGAGFDQGPKALGGIVALLGVVLAAWVIFFKAHL